MGLFRRSESDKRTAAARSDLDGARARLAAIDAGKAAALGDKAGFAKWQADRTDAAVEVDRLSALVATLEGDAEAARIADERESARRRLAAARKAADDLAERIHEDGQRIYAELLTLARDAAKQALEAKLLNDNLPEGEAPIATADILARDNGSAPREDIRSRDIELWVVADDGRIVGDQAAVLTDDGITGQLKLAGSGLRWKCARRKFKEIEFHPATITDWPGDLFASLRLPRLDGPGRLFDGAFVTVEQVAALDVAATVAPASKRKRPVQVELTPIEPWPPASTMPPGEAEQNSAA